MRGEEDITRCGDCWLKLQGAHLGRLQQGPAVPQRMAGAPRQRARSLPEPLPRLVHEAHLARQHRNALVQVRVGPPARGRDALNIRNITYLKNKNYESKNTSGPLHFPVFTIAAPFGKHAAAAACSNGQQK